MKNKIKKNYLSDKKLPYLQDKAKSVAGFTLMELVIGIFIFSVIVAALGVMLSDIANFGTLFTQSLTTQQEINQVFQAMVSEVRTINSSNIGNYAIEAASTSTLIFYADDDDDGLFERIRYFVSDNVFKRGITKPSGNPLVYNLNNEEIENVVNNITSSSIFAYYGQNYSGTEAQLGYPMDISSIRVIKVEISAKDRNQNTPMSQTLFLTPRNLRTNI